MIDIEQLSKQEVGKRIKSAREDRDFGQQKLADIIEIPVSALSKIANALDVKIEYLLGLDKDTNFIDDFIGLFEGITTSKYFLAKDEKVYSPEKLLYSIDKDYVVLTGQSSLFEMIKQIAEIHGQQGTLHPSEYKSRLNETRNTYKEEKEKCLKTKDSNSETFFLISGKQIFEIINILVNGEKALLSIGVKQINPDISDKHLLTTITKK